MCGILAISPKGDTPLNWARVKLLLLANESRGKHSTGLYTKSSELKLVKTASTFVNELNIKDIHQISPLLGHTRAPSYGTDRTISGAQPIIELDEEGNNFFSIVHNGTIHNMEELSDADDEITHSTTDTDTQILSKFIMAKKYSVLEEYYGAASLIWHRQDEPDAIYIFRGASANSGYSAYISEERPLHIGEDETGVYLSSTKPALLQMFDTAEAKESIEEVEANVIFKYENGIMEVVQKIDRSKVHQTKPTTPTTTYTPSSHHTPNAGGRASQRGNFPNVNDAYGYGRNSRHYDTGQTCDSGYPEIGPVSIEDYDKLSYQISMTTWVSTIGEEDETKLLVSETIKVAAITNNQVFFYKGRYRTLNHILSGTIYLTDAGVVSAKNNDKAKPYNFIKGVMLKPNVEFVKVYSKIGKFDFGTTKFQEAVSEFATQPVPILETYQNIAIESFYYKNKPFTGIFTPMFKPRGVIEIHGGYVATSVVFPVSRMSPGDKIRAKEGTIFRYGTIVSINLVLGVVTIKNAYDDINRINEADIVDFHPVTPTTGFVEGNKSVLTAKEEADLKIAKEKKAKAATELAKIEAAEAKIAKAAKVKNDMLSIMTDAKEEIKMGLDSASEAKVKIPKINKRIYNLIGHAIKSLNPKMN